MGIKIKGFKGLKKVLTGALALTMCLGATLTTMAGIGTPTGQARAILSKTVNYAAELEAGPDATFTFEFAKKSKDGRTDLSALENMPEIGPEILTFSSTEIGAPIEGNEGVRTLTKSSPDLLAGIDWVENGDGAGIYVWTVTELESGFVADDGKSMDYSQASFDLVVTVAYDTESEQYYVAGTQTLHVTDDVGTEIEDGSKNGADTEDGLDYNFTFTNIYSQKGGDIPEDDVNNEALVISKNVGVKDGDKDGVGDTGRDFSFTLTLNDSTAVRTTGTYVGTVYDENSEIITTHSVIANGEEVTFTLKHGQRLVFRDVPIGTVVNVTEAGTVGYTPSFVGMGTETSMEGELGGALSTGNRSVIGGENTLAFTNTLDNTNIQTGVLANNLPFITLIAAGILVVALFVVINKRKAMR